MDIDSLVKSVALFTSAVTTLKQLIALLPDSSKKADAIACLERAEREFKIAEAEYATVLQYEICRQHFPPVVMLSKDDKNWECPECHNTKKTDDYFEAFSQIY